MTKQEAFTSIRSYLLRQMILAQSQPVSNQMRHILWKRASIMAAENVIADTSGFPVYVPV